jgi:hypothetical protein
MQVSHEVARISSFDVCFGHSDLKGEMCEHLSMRQRGCGKSLSRQDGSGSDLDAGGWDLLAQCMFAHST